MFLSFYLLVFCTFEACPNPIPTVIDVQTSDITGSSTGNGYKYEQCEDFTTLTFNFVNVQNNIKAIPKYLFNKCKIESITIPDDIVEIQTHAFNDCTISTINFPSSPSVPVLENIREYAFYKLDYTERFEIPYSVTTIGQSAFEESKINSISFVSGGASDFKLTTIGNYAFKNTYNLGSFDFLNDAESLTTIGSGAFYCSGRDSSITTLSIDIPAGLTTIEEETFYETKISSITFPSTLQKIKNSAFSYLHQFTSYQGIDLHECDNLEEIGDNAFYSVFSSNYGYYTCQIYLPSSIQTIGSNAFGFNQYDSNENQLYHRIYFYSTDNFKSIGNYAFSKQELYLVYSSNPPSSSIINRFNPLIFPSTLTDIGVEAFNEVQNNPFRVDFHLATNLRIIGDKAFYHTDLYQGEDDYDLESNNDLKLSSVLEEIGESAFELDNVENPTNPNTNAFKLKFDLTSLNYLKRIGDNAFYFQKVKYPETINFQNVLSYIGDYAFCSYPFENTITQQTEYYSSLISSITFSDGLIQYIGSHAFSNQKDLAITSKIVAHRIEENAFELCTNLNTDIEIEPTGTEAGHIGQSAFQNCIKLTSTLKMTNPTTTSDTESHPLSTIDQMAFQNSGLIKIDLPHMLYIDQAAFYRCTFLTSEKTDLNVEEIFNDAFRDCISLQFESITSSYIGQKAFENCHKLNANINVIFNLDIDKENRGLIDSYAFHNCRSLKTLHYDSTNFVNKIGYDEQIIKDHAFYESGLSGPLTIPFFIKNIGQYAFADCPNLNSDNSVLTIESNIVTRQTIESYAFYRSNIGTQLTIPESVVSIGIKAFAFTTLTNVVIEGTGYTHLNTDSNGQLVPEPDPTQINNYAFYCQSLSNLRFGNGYVEFKSSSFNKCPISELNLGQIKTIPDDAFYGNQILTTVNIPDTLTSIGARAFAECSSLTTVAFNETSRVNDIQDSAFYKCIALSSTSIPSGVNKINAYTYYKCTQLPMLRIPDIVDTIDDFAFYGCSNFEGTLNLPHELQTIGESAFEGTSINGQLLIPDSLGKIEKNAFRGCSLLTGPLDFGRSIETIEQNAFRDCYGLTGITFYDYLGNTGKLYLGESAFEGCYGFKGDLKLPRYTEFKLTTSSSVGEKNIFKGCSGFNGNLYLPESADIIPEGTFYGCSGFIGEIPLQHVTQIYSYAFYDCSSFSGDLDIHSFTQIPAYSFYNCRGLNGNLLTSNSLSQILEHAFQGCSGLKGTITTDSITKVERYAFSGCSSLTGPLHFTEKLTDIQEYAFEGCSGFSQHLSFKINGQVTSPSTPLLIEQRAFKGCSGFKNGRLTFTIISNEEKYSGTNNYYYYRYDYFLRIGNEAFEDTKFKDIYYIGRFSPDCDYDIGISKTKGIHTSSNYANKTFCNYPLHSDKLSGGAIAGIVIACIVVVAAIVVLIVFLILRNKKNKDQSEAEVEMNQDP